MKKILILAMLAVAGMSSAQTPFKLEGQLEGGDTVKQLFIKLADTGKFNSFSNEDTIAVSGDRFVYSKEIKEITPALIYKGKMSADVGSMVFFVPGETLKLTEKGSQFSCDGSKIYKDFDAADKALSPLQRDMMNYYNAAAARLQTLSEEQQEALLPGIRDTFNVKSQAFYGALQKYLSSHIADEGALMFLLYMVNPEEVYGQMADEMKNGRVGRLYQSHIKAIADARAQQEKEAAEEQARQDALNGAPAPDFTLTDIKGNALSLSSLRGKYVVLDFWGSWCGWCIKGIPEMKKYYEKYAGKFEILGIDCNDSDAAWRKAVEKYELPWLHVYNPKNSTVLNDYGVSGFPTKVVVDPKGNIAKVIVGEDPAFYEYLDELFK